MHWLLRDALRSVVRQAEAGHVLRTDEEATHAAEVARGAKRLMLHDSTNEEVERFLVALDDDALWQAPKRRPA